MQLLRRLTQRVFCATPLQMSTANHSFADLLPWWAQQAELLQPNPRHVYTGNVRSLPLTACSVPCIAAFRSLLY